MRERHQKLLEEIEQAEKEHKKEKERLIPVHEDIKVSGFVLIHVKDLNS